MKTMKSSDLSAQEFFQLTVNSLLGLCTHFINGHCIVSIEGHLLLTLDTGNKVELNILQQDVGTLSRSVLAEATNTSSSLSSAVLSDVDKKMSLNTETGLTVENSVGVVSLDNSDVQQAEVLGSAHKSELRDTCADEDDTYAEPDAIPSAVLQPNGEFMCSSCGVAMKCARAIKRHLSVHTSLQSPEPSATSCHKTADTDRTDFVNKNNVKRNRKRKLTSERKGLPKLDSTKDNSEQWRSYVCKYCGDTFTATGLLNSHRITMHRPYKCLKCGMVLTGRRNFSQHVRKEHPGLHICKAEKSFVCEYCSRVFHDETQMKDHVSTVHLGAIEHRCDQCDKVLGSAITLVIHKRQVHERRSERTCDGCGCQFTRLAGLINHLHREHPHLLPDKYRGQFENLVCKDCNFKSSRPSALKRHIESRHGGAPKYMCRLCSRRFVCTRYVLRHIRNHHVATTNVSSMVVHIGDDESASVSDVLIDSLAL